MTLPTRSTLVIALLTSLAAAPALAQDSECGSDADCQDGFVCEVTGAGGCAVEPCSEDGECPEPVCEEYEYSECVPGPCQGDADCDGDQICVKETYTSEVDCPPNADCAPSDPIEETYSECRYRWEAPCEADSDCGAGFLCEEAESCWCNGSAGTACPDNAPCPDPQPAPEPECGCEPSGDFYCVLQEVECTDDSECEGGLVCDDNPNSAVCMSVSSGAPDGQSTEPVIDDCGSSSEPQKVCMPDGYADRGVDFGGVGLGGGEQSAATDGPGTDGNDNSSGDDGSAAEEDGSESGGGGDSSVGLCAVGPVGSGNGGAALWLLAAATALRLRRRRG